MKLRYCKVKKEKRTSVRKTREMVSEAVVQRCSENMQQIYRRTPIPKCDFNKVAKQLY